LKQLRGFPRPGSPPPTTRATTAHGVTRQINAPGNSPSAQIDTRQGMSIQVAANPNRGVNEGTSSGKNSGLTVLSEKSENLSPKRNETPAIVPEAISAEPPFLSLRQIKIPNRQSDEPSQQRAHSKVSPEFVDDTSRQSTSEQNIRKWKRKLTDDISMSLFQYADGPPGYKQGAIHPKLETTRPTFQEIQNGVTQQSSREISSDSENSGIFDVATRSWKIQDFSASETQHIDGLIPDAERSLANFIELPSPDSNKSSEVEAEEATGECNAAGTIRDIDEWIDDRFRSGKARNEKQAIEALRYSTMDPDLADRVLDHLADGNGVPQDMRGVWTLEDDNALEGTDARDIDRVLKKHGPKLYSARFRYLAMVRAAMLENLING
jgi:hypothetical protein